MSGDRPRGFVWYTPDYFGDIAVGLMPGNLRIVWVEAIFLMDRSPRRGVLLNSDGRKYASEELAQLMNVSISDVDAALQYIVEKKIADVERSSGALLCRKMQRDEIKRQACTKAGHKGGNPNLLSADKQRDLFATDNRDVNRPTQVEKDISQVVETKATTEVKSEPPAKEQAERHRDAAADLFADAFKSRPPGIKYRWQQSDFVHLSKLRKDLQMANGDIPEHWEQAVTNYFASNDGAKRTLGHLAKNYDVYAAGVVDRYGKRPGKGKSAVDNNKEMSQRIREQLQQKQKTKALK